MKYYTIYETLFPACFFAVAIWLCWLGLRVLQERRPVLFSARISFLFLVLFVLPFLVLCATIVWHGPRGTNFDINEIGLLCIPVLLWISWQRSDGLAVTGVGKTELDQALRRVADSLNLTHAATDSLYQIRFASLGVHYVSLDSSLDRSTRNALRTELYNQLSSGGAAIARRACTSQLIAGVSLFISGTALHYLG